MLGLPRDSSQGERSWPRVSGVPLPACVTALLLAASGLWASLLGSSTLRTSSEEPGARGWAPQTAGAGAASAPAAPSASPPFLRQARLGNARRLDADGPFGEWGFDLKGMDPAVCPCDDFYQYANGNWLRQTAIPDDRSSWSMFAVLHEETTRQLRALLERGNGSLSSRFYRSFMDEEKIEDLGMMPLQSSLAQVARIATRSDFAAYLGNASFGSWPFHFHPGRDLKDPKTNVVSLDQSGLGLPSRDYYLDAAYSSEKKAYQQHVIRMLGLAGWPDADLAGQGVVALEERIAELSWPISAFTDPAKNYHKMAMTDLPTAAPGFHWAVFLRALGTIPSNTTLVVSSFNATGGNGVMGIIALLGSVDVASLRNWTAFHLIGGAARYLPKRFSDAESDFWGKTMKGKQQPLPRWERAVGQANAWLGSELGAQYLAAHFNESVKKQVADMAMLLKDVFASRLRGLAWMTAATKEQALRKLDAFTFEIGYPKKLRSYEGLVINENDLFGNVQRLAAFERNFSFQQLGRPVDSIHFLPQTVNAYFYGQDNTIVLPAGILRPPWFNVDADMPVNFGSIGAVIGHEITHGFDNRGRKFDAEGKLNDWWTSEDAKAFDERAEALGWQYSNFTRGLPAGMRIQPDQSMGENIADLGGLSTAYDAYRLWRSRNSYELRPPLLNRSSDELEGDRRFFMGWAQVWRAKYTKENLKLRLTVGVHPPGFARGAIPPRNLGSWHAAFHVVAGDGSFLNVSQRVQIW